MNTQEILAKAAAFDELVAQTQGPSEEELDKQADEVLAKAAAYDELVAQAEAEDSEEDEKEDKKEDEKEDDMEKEASDAEIQILLEKAAAYDEIVADQMADEIIAKAAAFDEMVKEATVAETAKKAWEGIKGAGKKFAGQLTGSRQEKAQKILNSAQKRMPMGPHNTGIDTEKLLKNVDYSRVGKDTSGIAAGRPDYAKNLEGMLPGARLDSTRDAGVAVEKAKQLVSRERRNKILARIGAGAGVAGLGAGIGAGIHAATRKD